MIIETALIISFSTWLGSKIADKGFDSIYSKLTNEPKFDKIFNNCISQVANKFEEEYPEILGNSIKYFFTQEDVFDELAKLLFVNQEINLDIISDTFHEASLPKNFIYNFISELKTILALQPEFQELLANKELFIAVKGISKDINELSLNSSLTLREVTEIKKILEEQFANKFSLDSFLTLYKKNLLNNLGTINFIGLGIDPSIKKGKRKEIDKIFVKPNFKLRSDHHIKYEKENKVIYSDNSTKYGISQIRYSNLFDRPYNFVILGNPGAGKSLLIKSIICNLISNDKEDFTNKKISSYIPLRIELKNYLAFKKAKGGSIIKYLTYSLEEEYSVPSILESNLSVVLRENKAILFFDGLDEIFNATDKTQVKNDIENFHNLFKNVRSITTSRFIGYNEVKLDEKSFCELSISPFDEEQIEEYVNKWYSIEEEDIEIRNNEIYDFISKKGNIDNELLSNPLLLSLIVILYRNNLKIPESKLEIYQSCTNTLVDKWDASKNLDITLSDNILQKKEPILSDLAFWQYESLSSKNMEITYQKAKLKVAESLIKKRVADEFNCEQLAESFLNYAQKRSVYFDNNFTHKTFLEYYSAYWIYTNIEKKHNIKERNRIIREYISNPFWFIVLELLLNMIDKDQPDTEIIDSIFINQISINKSLPFIVYILPSINNVSEEVTVNIYKKVIDYLTSSKKIDQKRKDLFSKLIKNISNVKQKKQITTAINTYDENNRNLSFFILISELQISPSSSEEKLDIKPILRSDICQKLLPNHPYLFQLSRFSFYDSDKDSYVLKVLEYTQLFGSKELFKSHSSWYGDYSLGPFIGIYFHSQFKENNINSIQNNLMMLENESISINSLIKHIVKRGFYYRTDLFTLNYLCSKVVLNETIDKEKLLFVILLNQFFRSRFLFNKDEGFVIEDLITTSKIKGLLRKINKLENGEKLIETIIKDLNLINKDVLELV